LARLEAKAIDLTATIQTPENIEFEYRLSGPFTRFPALFVDFIIRGLIILAAYLLLAIAMAAMQFSFGNVFFGDFGTLVVMVFDFLLWWFYGVLFEIYWNGQTPGKRLFKIRVISADGRPINTFQAVVRNLVRPADFGPFLSLEVISKEFPPVYLLPTFLVAFLCMVATRRFQRLGDLAAGTMVVMNEKSWVPRNVKLEDPRIAALSQYIPANFKMSTTLAKAIALYVERRDDIPMGRRLELANIIASPLMKRFEFRSDTSGDLLLCALYFREFVHQQAFSTNQRSISIPAQLTGPISTDTVHPELVQPSESVPAVSIEAPPILSRE
jgi:uncharacterized RDD family membrane protein YckC